MPVCCSQNLLGSARSGAHGASLRRISGERYPAAAKSEVRGRAQVALVTASSRQLAPYVSVASLLENRRERHDLCSCRVLEDFQ